MKRILVIGCSGAGKSVFSRDLGQILDLPVVHLDRLHWLPGWVARDKQQFRRLQIEAMEQPSWIIDGNYGSTLDVRVPQADAIVWLDYRRSLCLYRTAKRYWTHKHKVRDDMAPGCTERLDWAFVEWIWGYPRYSRPRLAQLFHDLSGHKLLFRLCSPRDANRFLCQLRLPK